MLNYIPLNRDTDLTAQISHEFKEAWNDRTVQIWRQHVNGIPDGFAFDLDIDPLRDDYREWVLAHDPHAFLVAVWRRDAFRYSIATSKDLEVLFKLTWGGCD